MDVIALSRNAPQVTIEFDLAAGIVPSERSNMQHMLRLLTHPEKASKFHAFIQQSVEHLEYHFQKDEFPSLVIRTKKGHAKEWMHNWSFGVRGKDLYTTHGLMEDWIVEIGIERLFGRRSVHVDFVVDGERKKALSHSRRWAEFLRI
jgi:hypothetical protein